MYGKIAVVGMIFILLMNFVACSTESKMDIISKNLIFTDRRGYDQKIIDEDIQVLTKDINKDPNNGKLYLSRGFVYAAIHDFKKAIENFKKAESIDNSIEGIYDIPVTNVAGYLLGLACWQNGNLDEALKYLSKVADQNPKYPRCYYYKGMIEWQMGNKSAAMQNIETALSLNKSSQENQLYQETLDEMHGKKSKERIQSTFVICFLSNSPPQSRPFGYVWQIFHEVK